MTSFERRVATVVRRIPRGRVASYSMVADRVRTPGAARAVGGALARGLGVPAHRVVTADGRLVRRWPEQSRLLRDEGVPVRDGRVARPIPWWRA
ncbi:MAG TPA: MGMT family protein [Candidatus Limnocylindria bacterium]|nr:MGMT family protein [Candidatus Limnocylindria bacterium]